MGELFLRGTGVRDVFGWAVRAMWFGGEGGVIVIGRG